MAEPVVEDVQIESLFRVTQVQVVSAIDTETLSKTLQWLVDQAKKAPGSISSGGVEGAGVLQRLDALEKENAELKQLVQGLTDANNVSLSAVRCLRRAPHRTSLSNHDSKVHRFGCSCSCACGAQGSSASGMMYAILFYQRQMLGAAFRHPILFLKTWGTG